MPLETCKLTFKFRLCVSSCSFVFDYFFLLVCRAQGDTSQSSGEFALGASASDYSTSATASKTTPHLSSGRFTGWGPLLCVYINMCQNLISLWFSE